MSKYSFEFKVKIVSEYLDNRNSISGLSRKYKVDLSILRRWIHQAEQNGIACLQVKHSKRFYPTDFKLNVVRYYLNNPNLGVGPVAAKFNINSSQVYSWVKTFEHEGLAGLLPKQKGRPNMHKKTIKKRTEKIKLSEKQKYEEELLKKNAEIEQLKMENIVLKKVAARYPRYPINKKQ